MLKAIIFDMDGVIADTEKMYVAVKDMVLAGYGIKDIPLSYHRQFTGSTMSYQWKIMSKDFHLEHISMEEYLDTLYRCKDKYFEEKGIKPIRGSVEFVKQLKRAGYPLAIASSGKLSEIKDTLRQVGLTEEFDVLTSGWEVKESKPEPDIYLLAAERLGYSPSECIVIEDSPLGNIGAKKGGFFCLGFTNKDFPMSDMKDADERFESYDDISVEYLENLLS